MKISIDPVIASRIKKAWNNLPQGQRNRLAPLLLKAHQQAMTLSLNQAAPPTDPSVKHQLMFAQSALTSDQDGLVNGLQAGVVVDVGPGGEIWGTGKYQQLDPGWAEAAAVWLENLVLGKHAFLTTPKTFAIPNAVQVALAGDWGTGNWRTQANPAPSTDILSHMKLLETDLTIHLGDVYYAGTGDQEEHLLIELWPRGSLGALTLNSNHEMYSGAKPYFSQALTSNVFSVAVPPAPPQPQQSSYFALENDNWVIVGLDTAYYSDAEGLYLDGSLYQSGQPQVQVDFLKAQVAKGKKVLLLTHHNGLAQDGKSTTNLWSQVMSAFPANAGPACWYWGHAHAGVVYKPQGPANVPCRCCGHSALPWGHASELDANPNIEWYEHRSANDPDIPERVLNGFAVLYLDGPKITEVFYDENGGVAWSSDETPKP
jgi:hypothetical protein